jgi:hypothetical protein
MSAPLAGKFQDHYHVLGILPTARPETIQKVYKELALRFDPSNAATGDPEKFEAVKTAYEILSDPAARAMFDAVRGAGQEKEKPPEFSGQVFFDSIALEPRRRLAILVLLYDRRRLKPATGSLSLRHLEQIMNADFEQIQLTIWYLRARNLALLDDKSNLQITIEGMEYLEQHMPTIEYVAPLIKQLSSLVETAPAGSAAVTEEAAAPATPGSPEPQHAAPADAPPSAPPQHAATEPDPGSLAKLVAATAKDAGAKPEPPKTEPAKPELVPLARREIKVPRPGAQPEPAPKRFAITK